MNTQIKQYANNILASYEELKITWNDDNTEVTIHKANSNGFDVIVSMDELDVYILTDCGYHDHWRLTEFKNNNEALESIFGLVRDMLSENMQIKVMLSNKSPYRWILQFKEESQWMDESTTGLLFWNYFGRRREEVYKNQHLLPRKMKEEKS
ncbi:MAG: hypothetical protein AB8B80_11635 [Marinicellaceae bacterium]